VQDGALPSLPCNKVDSMLGTSAKNEVKAVKVRLKKNEETFVMKHKSSIFASWK